MHGIAGYPVSGVNPARGPGAAAAAQDTRNGCALQLTERNKRLGILETVSLIP